MNVSETEMCELNLGIGMMIRELIRSVIATMMAKRRSRCWSSSREIQKAEINPAAVTVAQKSNLNDRVDVGVSATSIVVSGGETVGEVGRAG